ncbi:MAG: alanine racemase [Oscillospiraceae bacterium]|nr:alanine racemase [Oscillospiraceae bacterium]
MNDLQKRTWAEISLDNIKHNYEAIRSDIPSGCRFLGVVKADAYGHGAMRVASLLQACGADYLAVSCLDEALELRDGGITMPILILGHTPWQYTGCLIENSLTQTVTNLAKAEEYSAEAAKLGRELLIHIKVDTGMSRLGFLCDGSLSEKGIENIARSCSLPGLHPEGIYTHFAVSDEPGEENRSYTERQFSLFLHVVEELQQRYGIVFPLRHCANSGAVVNYPEMALDMVRPGLLLYGYGDENRPLNLKPCMRFVTTVSTIKHYEPGTFISYGRKYETTRKTRVGVLALGYADGLPRAASGKCSFATPWGMAPQIGTVCMDMCMADLTDLYEAEVGTEVELFGEHADIHALAEAAGTIPYELLCSVTKRVPRVYK